MSVAALCAVAWTATANQDLLDYIGPNPPVKHIPREYTEDQVNSIEPAWPNPYLSFLPSDARPDFDFWRAKAKFGGRARKKALAAKAATMAAAMPIAFEEVEPNDTQATANFVSGFGTGDGEVRRAEVSGAIGEADRTPIGPFAEDDGSIPLANDTGLVAGTSVVASGAIGDGPFGSQGSFSGDFDFYRVTGVRAGQIILVDIDTPIPFGPLDSYVVLYDADGRVISVDDDDGSSFDSFLEVAAPYDGDYYVSIGGYGSFALSDPFDSASGRGVGSEGSYEALIGLDARSLDFFSFDLEAGDIIGASVSGAGMELRLLAPDGELRVASRQDATFIHPVASPLPGGGNAVLSYVIEEEGRWAIGVNGVLGAYELDLLTETAALRDAVENSVQAVFLDFDGADVNLARFGGPGAIRSLSPLASFLSRWGLGAADEDAVIDAIVAVVAENLSADMRAKGNNGDFDASGRAGEFDVEILNSRDHVDPFGDPHVSRVVIGGTIPEFGLATIGIAESIDPGNFETAEDSVVLLDILSAPEGHPDSLNSIPRTGDVEIIEIIAQGVGNIASHEAGHYSGNFHTDQFATPPNIMDQGGNLRGTVGVGPDGRYGTEDDIDVDFGRDEYVANEGFTGVEDTLNAIAFGLPTPVVTLQVGVVVDPDEAEATINTASQGLIEIAILGSASFAVAAIDSGTLAFGPAGAAPEAGHPIDDVNLDGYPDRLFHVRIPDTGIVAGDEVLCASGATTDATEFEGCDAISTLPRGCGFNAVAEGGTFQAAGPPNGGFETGDFSGWSQINIGSGGILVDDGRFGPPAGPGRAVEPFEGAFAALTWQTGPGDHTLYVDLAIAADLSEAKLAWADHLENHANTYQEGVQEWVVEVWDPIDNTVRAELHRTERGHPPLQDWTEREADLTPWLGQTVRVAFTQRDRLFFFNARLDAVELLTRRPIDIAIDIRPKNAKNGINPASNGTVRVAILGSAEFDIADLDPTTLGFGPEAATPAHDICVPEELESHVSDVNADGFPDLAVHFEIPESGITYGDSEACVTGGTLAGDDFRACDAISTPAGPLDSESQPSTHTSRRRS